MMRRARRAGGLLALRHGEKLAPWRRLLLTAMVVLCPLGVAAALPAGDEQPSVDEQTLTKKITEVEGNSELAAETRKELIEQYRHAISNLEAYEASLADIARYSASIESAAAESRRIEREIDRLKQGRQSMRLGVAVTASAAAIAQELVEARAEMAAYDAEVVRLRLALDAEQQRLPVARRELAESSGRLGQARADGDGKPAPAESLERRRARQWEQETSRLALGALIKKLDQELLSHGPRVALLQRQRELAELQLGLLRTRVATIETLLGSRRQADADQAIARARAAQLQAQGSHPVLVSAAAETAVVSNRLLEIALVTEQANSEALGTGRQVRDIEEEFRSVRQKLELAGMNKALGRILQEQRAALPSRKALAAALREREGLISDITLEQLILDDKIKTLKDIPAYADYLMQPVTDAALAEEYGDAASGGRRMRKDLEQLLGERLRIYQEVNSATTIYLRALSDLEYEQRRLMKAVADFETYLSERLLWVRSVPNPSFDTLLSFSGDAGRYLSLGELEAVAWTLLELNVLSPVVFLGLLLAAVIRYKRSMLREMLLRTNRYLGNPVSDHFSYTLQALLISAALSAPGPLVCAVLGWKLKPADYDSALAQALGPGLLWLSVNWFVVRFSIQICQPEGLAHRHFRWYLPALKPLRRELYLLMLGFMPLGFFNACLIALDSSGMEWGIVRLGLMLMMLLFALFFMRMLRPQGEIMRALGSLNAGVLLVRLRWFWSALAVILPVGLAVLTAMGYVYTAATLLLSLIQSFWLLLALVLGHQLAVRWLRKTATKLNYQSLQDERKRQLQAIFETNGAGGAPPDSDDESFPDLTQLGRGSFRLVNAITGVVATVGLLMVWSDVLPALGYLDTIQLWDSATMFDGDVVLEPITLADLGLALLISGAAFFLYRNLPALMELILLQLFSMNKADRYTLITLVLYTVVMISISSVAVVLGFEWSKFQWLAAALGVGIGFGLQEIVANFISGLILLFERPIRVGDLVTVGNVEGFVTNIRMRATTILTYDRQELLVPNKDFITGNLLNWSLSDPISRLLIDVGVACDSDVARAMAIITEIAENDEKVIRDPAPFTTFEGYSDSSLKLRLRCYLDDIDARIATASRLRQAIYRRFAEAGIVIALPQLDVHFDRGKPLTVALMNAPPADGA